MLHRYVWSQIAGPTAVSLLALNLLFLLLELLRISGSVVGAGLSAPMLGWLSLLFLPGMMVLAMPVAVLMGIMLALGRMSEDGEMVALQAAGVGPLALAAAPMAVGALAAVLAMSVSLWLAPLAGVELRQLAVRLVKHNVSASLADGRFFEEIPELVLLPGSTTAAGGNWQGFFLYDRRHAPQHVVLTAAKGRLMADTETDRLRLQLEQGQVHWLNWRTRDYTLASFQSAELKLELGKLLEGKTRFLSPTDHLGLRELEFAGDDLSQPERLRRLCRIAWHRRFSSPLAAIAFAPLAVALSFRARSGRWKNLWAAVAVTGGYYLSMRTGDALAEGGAVSAAVATWLPDVVVVLLGSLLLWQRERTAV